MSMENPNIGPTQEESREKDSSNLELIADLKSKFAGDDKTYSIDAQGEINVIIEDPDYDGGKHVKRVERSNESTDSRNFITLNEESYDSLIKAWDIVKYKYEIEPALPYHSYNKKNTFTIEKIISILEN